MVTRQDLTEIAALAHLTVDEQDWDALIEDMEQLLCFVKTIDNATGNTPVSPAVETTDSGREDTLIPSLPADVLLRGSKSSKDGFFVVKREEGGQK